MASKVAAQMYTVRDFCKTGKDFAESLRKISDAGYTAVQLSGVGAIQGENPDVPVAEARKMLDDNGLKCIATHRSWDLLSHETQAEIDFHHALACDWAGIGGLPVPRAEWGPDAFRTFVKTSRDVIAKLKAAGIRFGYHNHANEFVRMGPGPKTWYDILIDEGGPDLMLELDTYWAVHAGANPTRIVKRAHGRVPVVHFKDKGVDKDEGPIMCPIGEGNLDWDDIIPACEAAGTEWYAVEQDKCQRDPFDCLKASLEFLTSKGI
ncbi:MAG: sugar phosphate isomerase/epimerase [Kiritimatiellae bacterium]|nr:sugar phosphate isomerase/epimerase [Kiritimatiellia bacterium]